MEIRLEAGSWIINGYCITGNKGDDYDVYYEDNDKEILFSSKDFEECLTWCYNS